jgi:hypothetical protein
VGGTDSEAAVEPEAEAAPAGSDDTTTDQDAEGAGGTDSPVSAEEPAEGSADTTETQENSE